MIKIANKREIYISIITSNGTIKKIIFISVLQSSRINRNNPQRKKFNISILLKAFIKLKIKSRKMMSK